MQKMIVFLFLVLSWQCAMAEVPVTVQVVNVANDDAQLVISVFDSKKAWLKRPVMTDTIAATAISSEGTAETTLMLPAGSYAFHVFHDSDMNGKMKTNFIGIPKEPTGVSNDAKGKFGPPKFKDAAVEIGDEPATVLIQLTEI